MRAKLTLRIDAQLVEDAKACAQRNGKSAADFFAAMSGEAEPLHPDKTPLTRSLRGILAGADVDEAYYHRYLEDKYLWRLCLAPISRAARQASALTDALKNRGHRKPTHQIGSLRSNFSTA